MPGRLNALAPEPPVVARVGQYEVLRRLGLGGSSEVLLASVRGPFEFERIVAIKRLLPGAFVDDIRPRRFAREAVAYARLSHPAIVRLYDVIADRAELALVLEYVDGTSLRRLVEVLRATGERLDDAAAAFIGARVFAALEAAHDARDPATGARTPVIHRDVTPGNVLLPWDGFAKLADFGLAKVAGLPGDTRHGVIKGTYGYMAPEQVLGEPVTVWTDVYQACLVLYELFAGRPAFSRSSLAEIELLHAMAERQLLPIELSRPDLPPAIVDALRRGLRQDAAQRRIAPAEMVRLLRAQFDVERGRALLAETLQRLRPGGDEAGYVEPTSTPRHTIHPWTLQVLRSSRPPAAPISMTVRTAAPASPDSVPTIRPLHYATPAEAVPPGMRDSRSFRIPPPPPMPSDLGLAPARMPQRRRQRASKLVVFALVAAGAAAFVIAFAFMFAWRAKAKPAPTADAPPPPAATPVPAPPPMLAPAPMPSASAGAAPRPVSPSRGLVITPAEAAGHRVFVDGRLACAGATRCEVRCGRRVVRIGSQGRAQSVDVPCGGEIAIDR